MYCKKCNTKLIYFNWFLFWMTSPSSLLIYLLAQGNMLNYRGKMGPIWLTFFCAQTKIEIFMQNMDSDLYRQTLERTKYAPDLSDIFHIFWRKLLFRGRLLINPSLLFLKVPFFCNICELNLRAAMKNEGEDESKRE